MTVAKGPGESGAMSVLTVMGLLLVVACSTPTPAPVDDDYDIDTPAELRPIMTPQDAARVAVHHIAAQKRPTVDQDQLQPDVGDVTLARAPDAPLFEADVPAAVAQGAGPSLLVWIVTFRSADLVNPAALPWSTPGRQSSCGSIVVADVGATVLGVYPAAECQEAGAS